MTKKKTATYLLFLHYFWRRERDSNPRLLSESPVFKTGALDHSAISPCDDILSFKVHFDLKTATSASLARFAHRQAARLVTRF